tara:strand:+ start:1169 stop:3376 length:2208 start_codon:yes stop_codon:yes gene_type:complete
MGLYDHSDKKIYVVTLENASDLEGFYSDMASDGYQLHLKRPISRSTEYHMTSTQAANIRNDSRVAAVEINIDDDPIGIIEPFYDSVNNTPYGFNGDFEKSEYANLHGDNDRQWGHLHSSGSTAQRRKGVFGHDVTRTINENIEVFADGKHVDVVIVDNPCSWDCAEWNSPTTGASRFVQYDWYTELNQYISSIDDDGNAIPSGSYVYHPNSVNSTFHGTHVASTVAGQWYGWAREANIYSLHVNLGSGFGTPVTSTLVFDYLRAFHRYKPINPVTGKKNPTVTNHSWGSSWNFWPIYERDFDASGEVSGTADLDSVVIRGTTYNAANPGPSGWTNAGIHQDFGIGSGGRYTGGQFAYNRDSMSTRYDMNDAIDEGVVVIAAAGNNDQYSIKANSLTPEFADWNNKVVLNLPSGSQYSFNHHRGTSPSNAHGCITVGSISNNSDFRKSDFSNFGPMVDVWAPGDKIQGAWPDPNNIYVASGMNGIGYVDNKYGGTNWRYTIGGTSMASPQVCGIAALLATGKDRFTNSDVMGFIQHNSYENEMTFDINGGLFDDRTCGGGGNALHGGSTSTNREIRAINPRNVSGLIDGWYKETLKGERRPAYMFYNAQMYPRTNTYYRPTPPVVFPITVSAGSGVYLITGGDRNGTISTSGNPTINIKRGDTIQFTVNAVGHPLWIDISIGNGQTTEWNSDMGTITNNGAENDVITWDTANALTGTYYYNCEYHPSMMGIIYVNA